MSIQKSTLVPLDGFSCSLFSGMKTYNKLVHDHPKNKGWEGGGRGSWKGTHQHQPWPRMGFDRQRMQGVHEKKEVELWKSSRKGVGICLLQSMRHRQWKELLEIQSCTSSHLCATAAERSFSRSFLCDSFCFSSEMGRDTQYSFEGMEADVGGVQWAMDVDGTADRRSRHGGTLQDGK